MLSLGPDAGSVVVVGAGGGGIGTAIARAVSDAGATVIAVDRDEAGLATLVREIEAQGGKVQAEPCDATDGEAVEALFQRIAGEHERWFGLVNVVGGLPLERWHRLVDDDDENLDALLETNLRVAVRSSRAFARTRSDPRLASSIIQIASIAAHAGLPFGGGYAASKAALLSYTRTMALEWGALGIRVNAIAPGTIQVPKNLGAEDLERDRRVIPLGRRGTPQDVAGAALFLLSALSSWITGQTLSVDGGASVKPAYLDDDGLPVFVRDEALRQRLSKG